jgi:hypothetical protein
MAQRAIDVELEKTLREIAYANIYSHSAVMDAYSTIRDSLLYVGVNPHKDYILKILRGAIIIGSDARVVGETVGLNEAVNTILGLMDFTSKPLSKLGDVLK